MEKDLLDDTLKAGLLTGKYDDNNPLVLISKKKVRSKKPKPSFPEPAKILSKSKRKELQKQVAKKQKKLSRNDLWEELAKFTNNNDSKSDVEKIFSRNRRTEKKVAKSSKPLALTSKRWVETVPSSSGSSIDTDDISSDEEVAVEKNSEIQPMLLVEENNSIVEKVPQITNVSQNDNLSAVQSMQENQVQKPKFVLVNRSPEIQNARILLPIVSEESFIMEKITENDFVIICGATGCGKTTQLPQFLYEAGFTQDQYVIGITEPRRVAAISMCERVAEELNLKNGEVGYHIRYEKKISTKTQIKFMTDGILLQEIKKDFELSCYSAIIIDEAHERSIYTDVLLGLLSLIVRLRRKKFDEAAEQTEKRRLPLKLIIMSATLRVGDFADNHHLFPSQKISKSVSISRYSEDNSENQLSSFRPGAPPVVRVDSRQFPVTCHFSKVTPDDYVKAAFRRVASIHREQPPGDILVFLTGQREVKTVCNWLNKTFPTTKTSIESIAKPKKQQKCTLKKRKVCKILEDATIEESKISKTAIFKEHLNATNQEVNVTEAGYSSRFNLDNFDIIPADEETELGLRSSTERKAEDSINEAVPHAEAIDSDEDIDADGEALDEEILHEIQSCFPGQPVMPICALPLYSLLPAEQQKKVFEPAPEGHRLVVVATNVAETSLTIPNVRYVVDSGKVKSKVYDMATGASYFKIVWISQASAEQRAGRAGRVGPGHCYRLFSSRVFTDLPPFSSPDILTRPVDEVVLLLKSYLGTTPLSRFPLPTPPSQSAVEAAERRLIALGALEERKLCPGTCRVITKSGQWMARLPLPTRFARMLLFAGQCGLMPYAVILVASLSVPDFFLPEPIDEADIANTLPLSAGKHSHRRKHEKNNVEKNIERRQAFFRQFVKTQSDLLLGDLAILLGSVCCFERYWAQLAGLLPMQDTNLKDLVCYARVSRLNPEVTMRELVQNCGVRWKAYTEVRQLRRQLTDILNANIPDLALEVDPALSKPTQAQVEQLRQLFLAGSACQLAAKFDLPTENLPAKDRRKLRYAYKVPGVAGPVYIDPLSPLSKENCSYVAYSELHTSSKPLLRFVCAISPPWVPFLTPHSYRIEGLNVVESALDAWEHSESKSDSNADDKDEARHDAKSESVKPTSACLPPPYYSAEQDTVVAFARRVYFVGADLIDSARITEEPNSFESPFFELPAKFVPVPLNGAPAALALGVYESLVWSVRWFARALLEGHVLPHLTVWLPKFLKTSNPTRMVTLSWGLVRPEVRGLVSALLAKKVVSRRVLESCIESDAQFLVKEISIWIDDEHRSQFESAWSNPRFT